MMGWKITIAAVALACSAHAAAAQETTLLFGTINAARQAQGGRVKGP